MDALIRLAEAIERYIAHGDGSPYTANEGLGILRSAGGRHPVHLVHTPTLCVVARGSKQTTVGTTAHEYHAGQALVVAIDVPGMSVITADGPDEPYLSVVLKLDPAVTVDVLATLGTPRAAGDGAAESSSDASLTGASPAGAFVLDLDEPFVECILRAVRMLDTPEEIPFLYPALQREVAYRLLTGPHGADVAALTVGTERMPGVARAVYALLARFAEPLSVGELADIANLSPSAFHRRFKALTSMTPVQYQKQIRLLDARRRMLSEGATAESAAHAVGYESASQFSREYARLFGEPPRRDVRAVRASAA